MARVRHAHTIDSPSFADQNTAAPKSPLRRSFCTHYRMWRRYEPWALDDTTSPVTADALARGADALRAARTH